MCLANRKCGEFGPKRKGPCSHPSHCSSKGHSCIQGKCKFVAVVQKNGARTGAGAVKGSGGGSGPTVKKKKPVTLGVARVGLANNIPDGSPGNRSGNNGQVQLWQFLLELLTDKEHREVDLIKDKNIDLF